MADNVKFIFKTLIKVPVLIFVMYGVFNLFAFSYSYFRVLGISYVAMQTAIENNYLPSQELNTLNSYLQTLETSVLDNVSVTCDTDISVGGIQNKKVQYGTPIKVTVSAHYRFLWPLLPTEQVDNGIAASGLDGPNSGSTLSDDQLEELRNEYAENPNNNIVITYTIPGLKYYPDLS